MRLGRTVTGWVTGSVSVTRSDRVLDSPGAPSGAAVGTAVSDAFATNWSDPSEQLTRVSADSRTNSDADQVVHVSGEVGADSGVRP
ncbi:MAG: hypothetical protein Hals2KO_20190 [Halioglobus sp.]